MNSLTNSLSQNSEKTLTISEELVSTKDLAKSLGVDDRTIRNTVEKLGENFRKSISVSSSGGRPSMMFNKAQATAIKVELQNHSKVAQNGFNTLTISNDVEMLVISEKLRAYQEMRIQQLTQQLNEKTQKVIELTPDAESWKAFAEKSGNYCVTNIARCINVNRDIIFNFLKVKGYICRDQRTNNWIGTTYGVQVGIISNEIWTTERQSGIQMRITPKGMQRIQQALKPATKEIEETADDWMNSNPDTWIKAE